MFIKWATNPISMQDGGWDKEKNRAENKRKLRVIFNLTHVNNPTINIYRKQHRFIKNGL